MNTSVLSPSELTYLGIINKIKYLKNCDNSSKISDSLFHCCDIATSLSISLKRSINTCSNTSNDGDRIDGPKGTNRQPVSLKIGDWVALRQEKNNKFSTPFEHSLYRVIQVKGTMVTAINDNREITRNITFFRRVIVGNVNDVVQQASTKYLVSDKVKVLPELKLLENSLGENLEQDHAEELDTSGNSASQNYLSLSDSSVGDENDLESAKTSKVQRPSRACKADCKILRLAGCGVVEFIIQTRFYILHTIDCCTNLTSQTLTPSSSPDLLQIEKRIRLNMQRRL
ncbi:hypothetical protein BpHYR1_000593 [Brachionus plicatilis]|uniref:Retrovirus-related Pol poly from transposon n=1 Tax=Brachionus plicatilis TaxID=10195 RepID=A0A3M7R642_BRAPC|nr:hypothetical protein BpHYR1_000593 [Brachionus plicatilis]